MELERNRRNVLLGTPLPNPYKRDVMTVQIFIPKCCYVGKIGMLDRNDRKVLAEVRRNSERGLSARFGRARM